LRNNPGWWHSGPWNGNSTGPLTAQAFAGLLLRRKFTDSGGAKFNEVPDRIQWETVVRNFYYGCEEWTGKGKGNCHPYSTEDMLAYIGKKKLLHIGERLHLIMPADADAKTVAAQWDDPQANERSKVNFEEAFLNPDPEWKDGVGKMQYVPELEEWLFTAPMDFGNISMICDNNPVKCQEAKTITNADNNLNSKWSPEKASGLAKNRFFIARGYGNTAIIITLSQQWYWYQNK
jgi:hypothetical protein